MGQVNIKITPWYSLKLNKGQQVASLFLWPSSK